MTEQRRVGFTLPVEVYEQLLDEAMYGDPADGALSFWTLLQEYYSLSFIQGDTVICHPSFSAFIEKEVGEDKPAWVFEQESLKPMQCIVLAGPGRGQVLLDTLKAIERARDEAEREVQRKNEQRNEQLTTMFQGDILDDTWKEEG